MERKTKIVICFLVLILVFLLIVLWIKNKELEIYKNNLKELQSNYTNSIYVVLEDQKTKKKYYNEINDRKGRRKVNKFTPDKSEIIYAKECQEFYPFIKYNCHVTNDNDEEVEMTDTIKKIINQASKIEHDIIMNKIIKIDNQYFVVIELNVNLWTPYEFYYYNNKKDKLVEIATFDNYDVVGIKIKN